MFNDWLIPMYLQPIYTKITNITKYYVTIVNASRADPK